MSRTNKIGKVKDLADNQTQLHLGKYSTYSPSPHSTGYVSQATLVNYVDGLNSQYITTEITYETWKRAFEGTNKQLEERKSPWRLNVLTKDDFENRIYYMTPDEFIITELGQPINGDGIDPWDNSYGGY